MKKFLLLIMGFLTIISLSACQQELEHDIFVTVYPLQYITEQMLEGTEYTVGIVPGVISHESSVDWSPKEIIAMTQAKYLFYIGANYDYYIDHQIDSIFKNKAVELIKIEDATSYIEFIPGALHVHDHDDDHDDDHDEHDEHNDDIHTLGIDPHFWISPLKVLEVSALIYDKLIAAYPDDSDAITTNYNNLTNSLQQLTDDFQASINKLTKPVMTSTNLYGYLKHDYGLQFIPISPGYHEESDQFTSAEKKEIVDEAIYHEIRYIIYERNTTSPLSNAVLDELNLLGQTAQKVEFDILQSLTIKEITEGKNYINIMYENLELIKTAGEYQGE